MFRFPAFALTASLLCAAPAAAGPLDDAYGTFLRRNTEGALAVLGLAAVPSETASALVLDTGSNPNRGNDFQAAQLGGGFRISDDFPVYLEGYIGYNRYDPVLLLSDRGQTSQMPLKWTSVAATGGIGYEFDLTEHLVLRPQVHIMLGRTQTDVSVAAKVIGDRLGLDVNSLKSGGVTAGGVGGSLTLAYNQRWENDYELDVTLRHTQLHIEPIGGDKDLMGSAEAITTALWTRYRIPTGYELFDRPVRVVTEASLSHLPGDQGTILDEDWLAQIGVGGEIDLAETWVPWVTTTRLVFRYTQGEHLRGYSLGLACSF
ncbi:MAG: autotransporter outer membrane beta-barrel domain-containing protein [Rhodobacteraceae bacterium]|nr:autotransporter outer membrane beta-barrel domain-containing protein [Paracoccaceae bacterium]